MVYITLNFDGSVACAYTNHDDALMDRYDYIDGLLDLFHNLDGINKRNRLAETLITCRTLNEEY